MPSNEDIEAVVCDFGDRCVEHEVLVNYDGNNTFGNINKGDRVVFRRGSIAWEFNHDGKEMGTLPITEIKACFRQSQA